mmetsp:Transcript_16106/g.34975  ORF Transcript_16106/g.34975 Transcript_16106/m.34975 type:complete len:794 (+) Transcript_16106:62-2443(+)
MTAVAISRPNNGGSGGERNRQQAVASSNLNAEEIVSTIETKIQTGAAAAAASSNSSSCEDNGGNASGEVTATDLANLRAVAFDSDEGDKAIPVLDRNYLRTGGSSTSGSSSSIVRVIGFVQDQLDPEYYQTTLNGRTTKYRDYVYNGDDIDMNNDNGDNADMHFDPMGSMQLGERQPLVVVPMPFSTPWFRGGLLRKHSDDSIAKDEQVCEMKQEGNTYASSSSNNNNKRTREDDAIAVEAADASAMQVESTADVTSPARKMQQTHSDTGINQNEVSDIDAKNPDANSPNCVTSPPNHLDWWPAGTMGSDENQVPVLAKVYYDDDDSTECDESNRLRLNDVVEMVGIVHFDPMEADFSGQNQQQKNSGGGSGGGTGDGACGKDGDALLTDSFDDLSLFDRCSLPPPSLLPRLHVLTYNRVDLDEAACKIAWEGSDASVDMTDVSSEVTTSADDDRTFAINALSDHLFEGTKSAGEALLMTLMSMAERESSHSSAPGKPMQTPSSTTLGCASLNIILPTARACSNMKGRLEATLQQLVPVIASADLTLGALAADGAGATASSPCQTIPIGSPTKTNEGRLVPSIMQLPKGATLLINQGALSEGRIAERGHRTLVALSGLTQNHTVPYRFDGMMDYQFEGDYRVIVLSEGTGKNGQGSNTNGEKLLDCTMKVRLSAPDYEEGAVQTLSFETAERLRSYIARCRGPADGGNIRLSRDVLSRAERDFVDRRVANRERNQGGSGPSAEIGEEDFHRWLNVTRLQARSKLGIVAASSSTAGASLGDWEDALKLDDLIEK